MIEAFSKRWKWLILFERISKETHETIEQVMRRPIEYVYTMETFYRDRDKLNSIINGR